MGDRAKNHRPLLWRFASLILCVVAILAGGSLRNPAIGNEGNRSLLFVVDASERMAPYLPGVKGAILTYSDQSKPGDYLGIITFATAARQLTIKKITGARDQRFIGTMLDAISAEGDAADIGGGVARALEEVAALKRRGDKNVKGIIVISSSISSEEARTEELLEKALSEISKHVHKDEWYIQYCYLNGARDPQIDRFVSANDGFSYDVTALQAEHGVETIAELYRITSMPEELCPVTVADSDGSVLEESGADGGWVRLNAGADVHEESHIRVASGSRAVIALPGYGKLGLAPESDLVLLSARKNPMTGRATFHLAFETGSVWADLAPGSGITLKLSSADTMADIGPGAEAMIHSGGQGEIRVASFSASLPVRVKGAGKLLTLALDQSIRLGPGQTSAQPEPVEAPLVEKWKSWKSAFTENVRLASLDFAVPEVVLPEKAIGLGPIKSGDVQTATFPIRIRGVRNVSRVKMAVDVSLPLPEGLSLSTGVIDGDEPDARVLSLTLDGSGGFRSRRTETHKGLLRIEPAPNSGVAFEIVPVTLTITTKGPLVSPFVLFLAAVVIVAGAGAVGARFAFRTRPSVRTRPYRVIGRLIVVNDPTGGRIGSINLEELSTKSSRLSLVVGRSRTAEVRLKHASVSSEHCTIESHLVGGRLETFIEPIGASIVVVDGETISSKTLLTDEARITIGEFTHQFEDTQLYKKVDVVYRNGRQISGVLRAAGMDAEGFRISPLDAVSPSERARVRFSDIRYVTFYRRAADMLSGAPRPLPKPNAMKRVEFMFKKGNTISGYVQREYTEGRRRYVELLPLDPESDIEYTVVEYSAVVEKKTL